MRLQRTERKDIKALKTAQREIGLYPNQRFYEAGENYEVWSIEPKELIRKIPKKLVFKEILY